MPSLCGENAAPASLALRVNLVHESYWQLAQLAL
jgi:hypothetical protein